MTIGGTSTTSPSPPTGLRRIAAALTYRDFRVLWLGAFVSTIGTWMQKVAQNWLVLTITSSASAFFLGLDAFLGELPILLFTLFAPLLASAQTASIPPQPLTIDGATIGWLVGYELLSDDEEGN